MSLISGTGSPEGYCHYTDDNRFISTGELLPLSPMMVCSRHYGACAALIGRRTDRKDPGNDRRR